LGHQGLGDFLICNAIVRHFAKRHDKVTIPCKFASLASVAFMFRDLPNVYVFGVNGDVEATELARHRERNYRADTLGLGAFGHGPFDSSRFDQCFYEQAGLDFDLRWTGFEVLRGVPEKPVGDDPYLFMHDDTMRGFEIHRERLPSGLLIEMPYPRTETIFEFWGLIENAQEIHAINSSFALFADSIPVKAKRKVIHAYARPGGEIPTFRNGWEVLS